MASLIRRMISLGLLTLAAGCASAPREPRHFDDVTVVGLSPGPDDNEDAIVQVFAARTFEWFSAPFAVHTWIAARQARAPTYTVYEAHGWSPFDSGESIRTCRKSFPDRRWHGAEPELLLEVRGAPAEKIIDGLSRFVASSPSAYQLWPGPNSNSFIANAARETPGLTVDLPPTAVGKDYLAGGAVLGLAPSRTGFQLSLLGLFGLIFAWEEGLEVNVFGAVVGVDVRPPAIKLPMLGRLGFSDTRQATSSAGRQPQPAPEWRCH
jgi:hypothetical protein